jgi:CRP-like cAMP-binding protein
MEVMTRALRVQGDCDACACGQASRNIGRPCPFSEQAHERGEHLFQEGDAAERVYFIKHGTVVLARGSGDEASGRARAVRRDGTFVGLEALVGPRYLHSARVTEPTTVCSAPLTRVDDWLGPAGLPARTALEQMLRAEAEEPLHAASPDGTAVERVARWILDELREGVMRPLPRRDVAGLLGMAPETFSRALAELSRRDAIETTRRHLKVKDAVALRRAAGLELSA